RSAEVERALARPGRDDEPRELGATALGPDQTRMQRVLVDALDVQRVRQIRIETSCYLSLLPAVETDNSLGRLVLCAHEGERLVRAELLPPQLGDPVGVRVLERSGAWPVLGQCGKQGRNASRKPAEDRVRER